MAQIFYLVADPTGALAGRGWSSEADFPLQEPPPGGALVKVSQAELDSTFSPQDWYIDQGMLLSRVPMPVVLSKTTIAADGEDTCEISGLPDPCTVRLLGSLAWGPGEVSGGVLSITSSTPGDIRVRITAGPPYLKWEGTIHAD